VARATWFPLLAGCRLAGCGSEPPVRGGTAGEPPGEPSPDARAVAALLGAGAAETPAFFPVYEPSDDDSGRPLYPTALAWNPAAPDELWITLRQALTDNTCNNGSTSPCTWLRGRVAIVHGATTAPDPALSVETKEDANSWHFMRRPTSISFADDNTFATCAEARTSNYEDEAIPFNGPVLWSADPAIFGVEPPAESMTGSTHIDMLHESPYCMGIAHERDNIYWVMNGDAGSLDRYDFHQPHEPGGDDHSDGELERYAEGALARVPEVPSHLAFDHDRAELYAADSGHGRIVALDTTSGIQNGEVPTYDPIATHVAMTAVRLREIVAHGRLGVPSGLTLYRDVLFVTDALTSRIVAFDLAGHTLATLETGLPPGALGGIAVGPDGHAYFADGSSARVLRIDPAPAP